MPQVGGDPAFRVPNVHRQDRLRALQHLDLKFLVDREHDGIVGRVHVQPDHITYLGHHLRIRRQLERLRDVVLQPNVRQMRHGVAHAGRLGHGAGAPVRLAFRRRLHPVLRA